MLKILNQHPFLRRLWSGQASSADAVYSSAMHHDNAQLRRGSGKVWLVGAGPGDPELISVKGLRLIQSADVIIHDRLVSPVLLQEVRTGALLIDVGKRPDHHPVPQSEIEKLLCLHAQRGCKVVRLKGGDPFIFGRGGEEMLALRAAGITVEIVPGITAASACAAASGFPLTHRGIADKVLLITASRGKEFDVDGVGQADQAEWKAMASDTTGTLVFYMGLSSAPTIQEQLIKNGMNPDTPAALVENGSTPLQRTVICTLQTLTDSVRKNALQSPCLMVVGKVVSLAEPAVKHLQDLVLRE